MGQYRNSRRQKRKKYNNLSVKIEVNVAPQLVISNMKTIIKQVGFSPTAEIKLLPQSGSNRKFYRIVEGDRTAILMQQARLISDDKDTEFEDYIEINNFLRTINIDVPEIYLVDKKYVGNRYICSLLQEDIGDLSLQKAIISRKYEILPTYKSVIDVLLKMQILGGNKMYSCTCLKDKKFDYDALRWETDYFTKYFLEMYCGLNVGTHNSVSLQSEFHILASKVINEPLYFMHRDFQSQNIFLKDGKIRVIDFQSARQGLLMYDLAALLKDAYVEECVGTQYIESLLNYYLEKSREQIHLFPTDKFKQIFLYAGLQRNMQALGAFAFLSLVKNKIQFKQYVAPCLRYLKSGLAETNRFPELSKIVFAVYSQLLY